MNNAPHQTEHPVLTHQPEGGGPPGHPARTSTDRPTHPLRRSEEDRPPPAATVSLVVPIRRSLRFEVESEMGAHVLRSSLCVAEVPSLKLPGRSGRSNLLAISEANRVLRTLISERPSAGSAAHTGRSLV
ncbi:hypothetical protein ACFYO0_41520 [Streptomyces sp. NPDC006365]|uniref:hypothetical protein n=1 Tax=Streptomyces sp. NPDC006365 TaxID=3364744 RepID=UPI0036838DDE